MRKTFIIGAAVLTIVGATAFVSTNTFAQSPGTHNNMVQKLAQKLGLPEDKVKSAFDQVHTEHLTEMKKTQEERLSQLVADGKITDTQKQAIIAKLEEFRNQKQSEKEDFRNLTPEQRRQKMEAHKTELENWAKTQGIDLSLIMMRGEKKTRDFGHKMM
jgi:restriction endonuclease